MTRAVLISFFLHAAAIALALYLHAQPGAEVKEVAEEASEDFVLEAPLGHVFVTEAPAGEEKKEVEKPTDSAAAEKPMAFPDDVKRPGAEEEAAEGAPGTPDGEAQPLGKIEPTYPPVSRRLGEEGEAVFQLSIQPDGTVSAAELEKSSGFDRLDSAARAALLAATFAPAQANGQPAPARKRFRVEFRLEKQAPNR